MAIPSSKVINVVSGDVVLREGAHVRHLPSPVLKLVVCSRGLYTLYSDEVHAYTPCAVHVECRPYSVDKHFIHGNFGRRVRVYRSTHFPEVYLRRFLESPTSRFSR